MPLSALRTLGRSGLPVSPFALGTMTFGNSGWGSPDDVSASIFNAYVDAGGNFIDTADVYSGGRSEELLGRFIADRTLRDRIVLATKWSFSGGNGRKNLHRALEASLRRLQTDYVDLYWMHVWDAVTPAEELLQSMVDLIRAGKIRYFGLSDVPAWYAARMATLAQAHNVPGPIALQIQYSLTNRMLENEHVPAALALGLGIAPWSPLSAGFLTGKYTRDNTGKVFAGGGRLDTDKQPFRMFTERNWKILDALRPSAPTPAPPWPSSPSPGPPPSPASPRSSSEPPPPPSSKATSPRSSSPSPPPTSTSSRKPPPPKPTTSTPSSAAPSTAASSPEPRSRAGHATILSHSSDSASGLKERAA